MTTEQLSSCFESYLCDLTLEEYIEFLAENQITFARIPRFPIDGEQFVWIVPNHPALTARSFTRDHKQIRA